MKVLNALHRNPISTICIIAILAQIGCLIISHHIYNVYPVPNIFQLFLWSFFGGMFWKKEPLGGFPSSNTRYYPWFTMAKENIDRLEKTYEEYAKSQVSIGNILVPINGRVEYLVTDFNKETIYATVSDQKNGHHQQDIEIKREDLHKWKKIN